jgi:hypothetical protein
MLKRFIPKCQNCFHLVEKTQYCNKYNVPTYKARLDNKLCNIKAVGKTIKIKQPNQIDIEQDIELKNEYINKSKQCLNKSIGYFVLSWSNLYLFSYFVPHLSCILFSTLSGGFFAVTQYHVEEMNYYNEKVSEIENKYFLTNNTETTPETKHK